MAPLGADYGPREPLKTHKDGKPINVPYPQFCITPKRCAGRTCCPRPYACSE